VAQDSYNIIPVTLAVLLHASVFGSLFVAFDLSRSAAPPMQLAIRATLVTEDSVTAPPVVQQPEPEPPRRKRASRLRRTSAARIR